jgi:hypothetical protein
VKFRKKPVVIEAMEFTLDNARDAAVWSGGTLYDYSPHRPRIAINTLEGVMYADLGDWLIRGVKGEHYPCKPDIFAATYEPVVGEPRDEP